MKYNNYSFYFAFCYKNSSGDHAQIISLYDFREGGMPNMECLQKNINF